jgi:acyl transferase domain-containing protein
MNLYPNLHLIASAGFFQTMLGNDKDFMPTRVSYKLNLRGPSVNVQTACSTSLSAIHVASQSLLAGECDIALAGGISVSAPQKCGYQYLEGGIFSPDAHCRAFDAGAKGTVGGNGVGIVVLKRLPEAIADRDTIHAVVKGSAINNDGALKIGYTAPSIEGQEAVIAEAHAVANVEAETISYIEAHGTGTLVGDPIEIEALTRAFRGSTEARGFCAVGSLKTNIGHLDTAAGVAGFIKTVLALKHRQIPPSLMFESPNPAIDFANSPFYVNTSLSHWQPNGTPLRAGVSSFGIGGTNVHVVLEEAPAAEESSPAKPWNLLVLSAKTESALQTAATNLAAFLKDQNLTDVAYTLQVGRKAFEHRLCLVADDPAHARIALENLDPSTVKIATQPQKSRSVAFMFPGQGAQYVDMAKELYLSEPYFAEVVNKCADLLQPNLKLDLRDVLFPSDEQRETAAGQIIQTAIAQPALFVVEYALAKLWMHWGVRLQALIGHSIGEYVAACLAGVFSLEDALWLVTARGRLMQQAGCGEMLAVPLSEDEVASLLGSDLSLASVNGPSLCVVSGPTAEIDKLNSTLTEKGLQCRRLRTSHAFHSRMMDAIVEPFAEEVRKVSLHPPQIRCISNLTGTWLTPEQATDSDYWAKHLRQTVRFADGLSALFEEQERLLLEVGPGQTLTALASQHPARSSEQVVVASMRPQQSELKFVLGSAGQLWLAGVNIDWARMYEHEQRRRISLPTYPFERQRYWVEPKTTHNAGEPRRAELIKKTNLKEWFYTPSWKRLAPSIVDVTSDQAKWLVFFDQCGLGSQVVERLTQAGGSVKTVSVAEEFVAQDGGYTINPQRVDDYVSLIKALKDSEWIPDQIVHLWSVTEETQIFERAQSLGFYSLLSLTQALAKAQITSPLKLCVVTTNVHEVIGDELICPEKATVLGPCKVISQEYPHITTFNVDVCLPTSDTLAAQITAELNAPISEAVICRRGNHRWAQTFEPLPLTENKRLRLRTGGHYLLAGGLGSIGYVLAEYLASTIKPKLVLTGRTILPDKAAIQALEALGAEVHYVSADLAQPEQLNAAVLQARERFGPLHGVIHAAGLVGEDSFQLISDIDPARCEQHFSSKAHGLFALKEAIQHEALDFVLITSSLSAVLGGLGFSAYAAANVFMDAFVQKENRESRYPWISVDWDAWRFEKKDGPNLKLRSSLAEIAISPEEGRKVFELLLGSNAAALTIVSTADLKARLKQWVNPADQTDSRAASHQRPKLRSSYIAPRNETEETIAEICQEILGIDRVGIADDFFELGSHSLQAAQLASKLSTALHTEVSVRMILTNPNIGALAEALTDQASSNGSANEPLEVLESVATETTSEFTTIESRPLRALFVSGELAPVNGAALSYLPASLLAYTGLSAKEITHGWCANSPLVGSVWETTAGRLASVILPRFDADIYRDKDDLISVAIEALELASQLGARQISLTGIIPSATNYGHDLATAIKGRSDLPQITTGHATTSSSVVLNINRILQETDRDLVNEQVGFLGLGSIGMATLRLMLKCLPHPPSITLCDVFNKRSQLEALGGELRDTCGYRGELKIVVGQADVAPEIYDATLIIGATNVPNILDITRVNPGTLIVDDSAPHCFDQSLAIQRLHDQHDILFTEGGMLRAPEPIKRLVYLPNPQLTLGRSDILFKRDPHEIFGCMFSGLLTNSEAQLGPTLGFVDVETCFAHYEALNKLNFKAAGLHCEDYRIPDEEICEFRSRFSHVRSRL